MSDTPDPFDSGDPDDVWPSEDLEPEWEDDRSFLPAFDRNIIFGVAFCN